MASLDIEQRFFVGLAILSIVLWLNAAFRMGNRKPLLMSRSPRLLPWLPEEVFLGLAGFVLIPGLILGLASSQPDYIRLLIGSFAQLFTMLIVGTILFVRHRAPTISASKLSTWIQIALGISVFVMWIPLILEIQMILTQWFPYEHTTISVLQDAAPENRITIAAITFFSAAFCAPIAEEFFIRWLLQGYLQKLWFKFVPHFSGSSKSIEESSHGKRPVCWLAILATSLLFAALHAGQGPAPIPLFFLSIGIGYLFDRTGSLISCIVVHFLLNGLTMSFLILQLFDRG